MAKSVLPAMGASCVVLGIEHHPATPVFTDLCSNTRSRRPGSVTPDESFTFCVSKPPSQEALYTLAQCLV